MTLPDHFDRVVAALRAVEDVRPAIGAAPDAALFVGSGDSLSSALLATAFGHLAASSGDLTWTGRVPAGVRTVVGISHSGTSGATVRALRLATEAGLRTVAVTSNLDSPLAEAADEVQLVPSLGLEETVPCAGHLMLGLGVAAVCGVDTAGATAELAALVDAQRATIAEALDAAPAAVPSGISVLSLPELRGAADFWVLKLIEATGLVARTVPLEESGHVDYFIGPQANLSLQLVGADGAERFARLATALESTGQTPLAVGLAAPASRDERAGVLFELAGAVAGTVFAEAVAARWGRPPFRGGAVNMDASHIKLDGHPVTA